jgi:hypothetical protein
LPITSPTIARTSVAAVGAHAAFEHAVEDAALDGLEAVAHVGQRPPDDHAHRVVEIGFLHLDFDVGLTDD